MATKAPALYENPPEAGQSAAVAKYWGRELESFNTNTEKWRTNQAPKAVKSYIAEEARGTSLDDTNGGYPIFWSNVNILKAAMYARMPTADVSRRFKDPQDDVGRVAGEIIERILNADMQDQEGDVDSALRQVVEDRLVAGLGQAWCRYDPVIITVEASDPLAPPVQGKVDSQSGVSTTDPFDYEDPDNVEGPGPDGTPAHEAAEGESVASAVESLEAPEGGAAEGEPQQPNEQIVDENAATDYVHWSDFAWSPCRVWSECRWVGRRVWMTREQLVKRFGAVGKLVPLDSGGSSRGAHDESDVMNVMRDSPWQKAGVWEIWCKRTYKAYWIVTGFDQVLDERPDPLQLKNFFPCPRPMIANNSTSGFVPKPDYSVLGKVYMELELVFARLSLLEQSLRVVGVYDKNAAELRSMLSTAGNQMVPVDNWAMFAEKGGIKGVVDWFPLDMVITTIVSLREVKQGLMHDLYELTGLSDIMRGATVATETATAQQLKAQFASIRLQYMQGEFARFVQDLLGIKAEIMAGHFQEQTLIQKSMIDKSFDAQNAPQAIKFLRDKKMAHYALTVDPDSMAMVDYMAQQEAAQQFLGAFATFLQQAMPLAQMDPRSLPFLLQILSAVVARYKFGKQVEGILDNAIQSMMAAPPTPKEPSEMEQVEVGKKKSEIAKNLSQAEKNIADAKAKPASAALNIAQANEEQSRADNPMANVTDIAQGGYLQGGKGNKVQL